MRTQKIILPAKLSPPRLQHAVTRERLFAWIDAQLAQHAAAWIGGAPGAGKTTLVVSYCQARSLACVWYRFDADDNDLGRFFSLYGQAVDAAVRTSSKSRRPIFDAEHSRQPRAFARAWFRHTFATLPRPLLLVFDNLEHAALPRLPELLACAIDELPEGITLLMTSRHAAPAELASACLNGTLAVLDEADLQFTNAEAADYARVFGLNPLTVAAAAQRTQGWAAGLRLVGDGGKAHTSPADATDARMLFDYFAELLRENVDDVDQHMLVVAALLPWIPLKLLAALTNIDDVEARLTQLCANHFFTEQVASGPATYRLHPLFRQFLLERGLRTLAADAREQLLRAAAQGFNALGEPDAALDLSMDAGDWDHACTLLHSVFESKLALGQLDQLASWAARVPAAQLDADAQLRYFFARLCFLREDDAAITHYEQSCRMFAGANDWRGQQLCAAGVLEWSYNTDNFLDHPRWIAVLRRRTGGDTDEETNNRLHAQHARHELRLLNGRLLACFFDGDFDAEAALWLDQVLALLTDDSFGNEKISTAITLLGCLERHKRWDDAQLLAGRMHTLINSPRVSTRLKILARLQIAIDIHRQTGDYAALHREAAASRRLAHEQGFAGLEFEAVAALLYAAQYVGDEAETRDLLVDLGTMIDPANIYHQRLSQQMHTWFELLRGHLTAAQEHADLLRAAIARSDMPARFSATWLQPVVYVQFASGARNTACTALASMVANAEPGSKQTLHANALALEASIHLDAGHIADAETSLTQAFTLAAGARYYGLLAPLRNLLSVLCSFALDRGIAPLFTRELIVRRRLRPPAVAAELWPWPIRIYTLGRFALSFNNELVTFSGKVPKKPLALLKTLIALGGPHAPEVAESALTDALWPDDDADAAHDAFNVALHRLRKLIPNGGDVIRLQDGRLSLDRDACWVDCHVFEISVEAVDTALAASADALPELQKALNLYRGRFLSEDRDAPWSLSARERLRSKFNRVVVNCARALSAAGRDAEALACYQRGIETDDLAEAFYVGAMHCMVALKRPADGLAIYQRLERMLSIALAIKPSQASQAVRRQLLES